MALDVNFPNPQEEFERLKNENRLHTNSSQVPLSIEVPEGVQNAIGETDFQPFQKPYQMTREEEKPSPGALAEFAHGFKEEEVATKGLSYLYDSYQTQSSMVSTDDAHSNPFSTAIPDGWTPNQPEILKSIPQQLRPWLMSSENPSEFEYRRRMVDEIQQREEYYNNGSIAWQNIGKGVGFATDFLLSLYIPMAASAKYATYSGAIFTNMARQAPSIGAVTLAYTAADDASTAGKTMEDFFKDSFVNTVAGIGLTGAAGGLGRAFRGGDLYEASKRLFKANLDGVEAQYVVNKEGVVTGMKAAPVSGQSVSAAKVNEAQEALDAFYAKIGFFKIPVLGKALEKGFSYVSPELRGLSSDWMTINKYTNRLSDHNILTEGTKEGKARPANYEALMRGIQIEGIHAGIYIEGQRQLANGMSVGKNPVDATKRMFQRISQGELFTKESWSDAVYNTLISGEKHESGQVNATADFLTKFYKKQLSRYQIAHGLEEVDLPVRTAAAYLSRQYDVNYMLANRPQWNAMVVDWFRESDSLIESLQEPVNAAMERVRNIKTEIQNGVNVEQNRFELLEAKRAHRASKNELRDRIHEDESMRIHLDEMPLSRQEVTRLKSVLKPWKDAKRERDVVKRQYQEVAKQLKSLEGKYETGEKIINPESKDYEAISSELQTIRASHEELKAQYKELKDRVEISYNELLDKVANKEINRSLYYRNPETGAISFKKPTAAIKFRPLFSRMDDPENEMLMAAESYFNKITSTDPEKLSNRMLEGYTSITTGSPLMERSLMIPDKTLLDNNFLLKDIIRNSNLYATTLGRKSAMSEALSGFSFKGEGIHGVIEELAAERRNREDAINARDISKEKKDKLHQKLANSFKKQYDFIQDFNKVATKQYGVLPENAQIRQISNAVRSYVAATKLGNVPLAMIPDMSANILRHGVWRTTRDFILPAISNINGLIKTERGRHIRKSAEEAGLCLEAVINSHAESLWNHNVTNQMTVPGKVVGGLEYIAKLEGNVSLANSYENMNQKYAASLAESRILEAMFKHQSTGKLSTRESRFLADLGIDANKWSKRVVDAFESGNSRKLKLGTRQSEWWDWKDSEAGNMIGNAIRDSTFRTIIRRGMFSSPLWANDPVLSMFFSLTGWFFSALSKYTIPMLQNPFDSYLMTGMFAQTALGSLVDPMRRWSKGEEFKMDEDHWFASALSNTAPFAAINSAAMFANAITGNQFLSDMKNDRHRDVNLLGSLGGPAVGSGENLYRIMRMFASGKYNKQDVKLFANSIPLTNMWYTNQFKNEWLDRRTEGLPRNYTNAEE